jgi:hypothetical protein
MSSFPTTETFATLTAAGSANGLVNIGDNSTFYKGTEVNLWKVDLSLFRRAIITDTIGHDQLAIRILGDDPVAAQYNRSDASAFPAGSKICQPQQTARYDYARMRLPGPSQLLTNGSMAGDLKAAAFKLTSKSRVTFQVQWTSADGVGTPAVQVSDKPFPDFTTSTDWEALTFTPGLTAPASANGSFVVAVTGAFAWIRVVYTRSSGSGTMNVWGSVQSEPV